MSAAPRAKPATGLPRAGAAEALARPQPRRGQLIASSVLLGLWILFLAVTAITG